MRALELQPVFVVFGKLKYTNVILQAGIDTRIRLANKSELRARLGTIVTVSLIAPV